MPLGPTLVGLCPEALQFCPQRVSPVASTQKGGLSSHGLLLCPRGSRWPLPRQGVATCWTRVRVTVL